MSSSLPSPAAVVAAPPSKSPSGTPESCATGSQPRTSRPRNRGSSRQHRCLAYYVKPLSWLRCWRLNRVDPGQPEAPDSEYLDLGARRRIRVLRPRLLSPEFYDPGGPGERRESINDNFYTRWARRPHPSGNCRCSFRQSSRLSATEETISKEIARIRTSLCEAEINGIDIDELERSVSANLANLEPQEGGLDCRDEGDGPQEMLDLRLEPLDEAVKQRIVKDLDNYISGLLDEILDDTIKAIAETQRPFANNVNHRDNKAPSSRSHSQSESRSTMDDGGYDNRGFVGSETDPDALDCPRLDSETPGQTNKDLDVVVVMENLDCPDSGIHSVETLESLQHQEDDSFPAAPEHHNLEQSLIDIIDAKLGGTSIGKSLEDLTKEIDRANDGDEGLNQSAKSVGNQVVETLPVRSGTPAILVQDENGAVKGTLIAQPQPQPMSNGFKKKPGKATREDAIERSQQQLQVATCKRNLADRLPSRMNRTVSVIRQKLATSFNKSCKKKVAKRKKRLAKSQKKGSGPLELEDYRRRFPLPSSGGCGGNHISQPSPDSDVALRNFNRKPYVVFIHGFGSSAEVFSGQLKYFSELGYPCLAPDMLGHGLSSAPNRKKDYHFLRLLRDFEEVLKRYVFRPGQKVVLVGHNYGCSFATALASKHYNRIQQLILISGGGPTPLAPPSTESLAHCCLRVSLNPFVVCGLNRSVLYATRGRQHPYCGDEPENQRPSHMRHVLKGMSWPEADYVFHRRICIPTLLVHGLRDQKVSLVQECQMERTMIKAFLEALPSAGHMPMIDCPEQLNHMIHCFIDLWKNKKW